VSKCSHSPQTKLLDIPKTDKIGHATEIAFLRVAE